MTDTRVAGPVFGQRLVVRLETPGGDGLQEALAAGEFLGQDAYLVVGDRQYPVTLTSYGPEFSPPPGVLTPTQEKVAALACAGLKDQDIADKLYVSINTVHTHMRAIFKAAGVTNRIALAAWAMGSRSPVPEPSTGTGR